MARTTTETPSLASGPTIASTRDYWTLHLRSVGRAPRTIATYLRALDRLDPFLVERGMPRELGAIRREHLEAFLVELQARGNAPATVSILFRALRPFFALARRRGRDRAQADGEDADPIGAGQSPGGAP